MDFTVTISVSVTAGSPEEAGKFALADLRDTGLGPWEMDVSCSRGKKTVSIEDPGAGSNQPLEGGIPSQLLAELVEHFRDPMEEDSEINGGDAVEWLSGFWRRASLALNRSLG